MENLTPGSYISCILSYYFNSLVKEQQNIYKKKRELREETTRSCGVATI